MCGTYAHTHVRTHALTHAHTHTFRHTHTHTYTQIETHLHAHAPFLALHPFIFPVHISRNDTSMSPAAISVLFALGCLSTVVLHVLICVIAQYIYWRRAHSASPGRGRRKKRSYSRLKIDYHSDDSSEH